ncbi:hypothetical protein NFIA_059010 [Paecilomyces variotii No. 5]|uniref:Leucine rich repeat protein n=1 Tax=Byssochlamys spectabilis (strain No. 5 / NBRC 109023) TaxID=1356009 RepID=V5FWG8_BYSSN|nr:hypothetical protein NFIA_059010 [Paecilomyces variotii No. 5]
MGRLNYSARKIEGLKAGQVLSKDLKKRIPPGVFSKTAARDPTLEIDIADKNLTDEGFDLFIDDLIQSIAYRNDEHPDGIVRLAELHLSGNNLTAQSLKKLSRVISLSAGDLRELDLSDNKIEIREPEHRKVWQEVLESFQGCYVLKKLDFSRNPLGPRGAEILARVYMQSELDFLESDPDEAEIPAPENEELSEKVQSLTFGSGKENQTPKSSSKRTSTKGGTPLSGKSVSSVEKIPTQMEIKHYSCTRGLRSVPYLILSDISMTNASAVHLSTMLSIHRAPEQLLSYLPGGKALVLPDTAAQCKGIIWLPNKDLGSLGHKLLDMADMVRDMASDIDSDDEHVEDYGTPSKTNGHDEALVTDSPSYDDGAKRQRQIRNKMSLEFSRLAKRVRIEVLQAEGVHSADIWSVTLKMMVICRALLLDDKDRRADAPTEEAPQPEKQPEEQEQKVSLETRELAAPFAAAPLTAADIVRGRYSSQSHDFALEFPALPTPKPAPILETPRKPKNDRHLTPPSQSQATHAGTPHVRNSPVASSASGKVSWRFGLPIEVWRMIIADAVGADGILDREQQLRIIRYASDWNALAYELTITGAADHQQIWKFLDTVNCFTYNPRNAEQDEPTTELPMTDSESEIEDFPSEVNEEEMKKWLSTAYERGSKRPLKEPLTAPLDLPISDTDVEKLKVGFKSQSMDDKWDFLIEDPDENGGISLHIIRNWLQAECYIFHIVPKPSNDDGGSARIQSITWEGNKSGLQCDAEQANKEAVILCRGWLHCEFDALPQYPSSVFWDPQAYKKLADYEMAILKAVRAIGAAKQDRST